MDVWAWLWIGWIVAFVVIEGLALKDRDRGDTLSEHVWEWFSVKKPGPWAKARRTLLAAFMLWLSVHFLTGGWI